VRELRIQVRHLFLTGRSADFEDVSTPVAPLGEYLPVIGMNAIFAAVAGG
jgi:hypothetical protein